MIDDNNKDPTFVYKVPDTVYKVPTRQAHAAQMLGMPPELGYGLRGEAFIDMLECAFNFRQAFDAHAEMVRAELRRTNWPSPLRTPECGSEAYNSPYYSFAQNFREAESRMERSLWAPLH